VDHRDIVFINACSNHRKEHPLELASHLGGDLQPPTRSAPSATTTATIRGCVPVTPRAGYVEHNRDFIDADLRSAERVSARGVEGLPARGRSSASHRPEHRLAPQLQHGARPAEEVGAPEGGGRLPAWPEMTAVLEEATGKKIFYVNAVTGMGGRPAAFFAGHAGAVTAPVELAGRCF
jgi:hypothetical protein